MLFCWFAVRLEAISFNKISINFFFLFSFAFRFIASLWVLLLHSSEIKRHAINNNKGARSNSSYYYTFFPLFFPFPFPSFSSPTRSIRNDFSFSYCEFSFSDPLWSNNNKKCCQTLLWAMDVFILVDGWRLMNCSEQNGM